MSPVLRRTLLLGVPLVLLTAAWLAWTAVQARSDLEAARTALPAVQAALSAGSTANAVGGLERVREHAVAAHDSTHDPVWFVASHVPVLGRPLATVRGITEVVRDLSSTGLPALASVADDLQPAALRPEPDRVDVQRLASTAGPLQVAAQSLAAQQTALTQLAPSWLGPVASARSQLLEQVTPLATTSRKAATAAQLLPDMLGLAGPRRYFVGFQNPAEARGTGGLLGAFALLQADDGRVRVGRLGSNGDLPGLPAEVPGLDPEFVEQYSAQGATALWVNANVTPDFPEAARTWLAMWQAGTGDALDGALALDPRALAALVRATGPLDVPGLGQVDADRVEPLVLREQYELTDDVAARKDVMVDVGRQAVDALLSGQADASRLVEAFGGLEGGHVLVHSAEPREQTLLSRAGLSGEVTDSALPFAQAVVVNAAGGKLDSYLDTSTDYRISACTSDTRTAVITVRLRNSAPVGGLPSYVTTRADDPPYRTVPGQNLTDLRVLLTRNARVESARLDGEPLLAPELGVLPDELPETTTPDLLSEGSQAGRPSYGLVLELVPGAERTLELTVREPPSTLVPLLPVQPLARPMVVTSDVSECAAG